MCILVLGGYVFVLWRFLPKIIHKDSETPHTLDLGKEGKCLDQESIMDGQPRLDGHLSQTRRTRSHRRHTRLWTAMINSRSWCKYLGSLDRFRFRKKTLHVETSHSVKTSLCRRKNPSDRPFSRAE